ncbi:MAG: methyl-accepting chemotaxis protein [Ruminococcaceae bacterium]|nr:methyl-accepting chemotaxis protein [Oscillospiraceae bacterium]
MKKSVIDEYLEKVFVIVTFVITGSCLVAGIMFNTLKSMGFYENVSQTLLTVFLCTNFLYIAIGIVLVVIAFKKIDGKPNFNYKIMPMCKVFISLIVLIQWNFIIHMLPSRDFWAFIFYFLILPSLFLDFKMSSTIAGGLIISLAIQMIVRKEEVLPVQDDLFIPDMVLRIVAVVLSCAAVLLLTFLANRYLVNAKKEEMEKSANRVQNVLNGITEISGKLETASVILSEVAHSESASAEQLAATGSSLMQSSNATLSRAHSSRENIGMLTENTNVMSEKLGTVDTYSQKLLDETAENERSLNNLVEVNSMVMSSTAKTREVSEKLANDIENVVILLTSINDIAFSTNILAINAAIEAAHAGELGQGFAVVATEVGELANRSRDTVNEIQKVIEEVNRSIKSMTGIVSDNAERLNEQNASIKSTYSGIENMISMLKQSLESIDEIESIFSNQESIMEQTHLLNNEIVDAVEQENSDFSSINDMITHNSKNAVELAAQVETIKSMIEKMAVLLAE